MNENGKSKREWVKTAAIIFLAVMLVLTFFSNTIMNYSLPEVATQYVMSGTITARIRGTGVIESGDPYEVKVTESRKVSSVAVRVGDKVQKGDVLLYLAESESTELEEARGELEKAQNALQAARDEYNKALLTRGYTEEEIRAANSNTSTSTYRRQLTDAQNAIKPLQATVDQLSRELRDIEEQVKLETALKAASQKTADDAKAIIGSFEEGTTAESLKTEVDNAEADYKSKKDEYDANSDDKTKEEAMKKAEAKWKTAQNNLTKYNNANSSYNSASSDVSARDQNITNLNAQSAWKTVDLYNAQKELTAAEDNLNALKTLLGNMVELDGYLETIRTAQEAVNTAQAKVDEEAAKAIDATVTADIAGTVTAINVTAGNTTSAAVPVVVLQPEGRGYTLSFSVTNDQARRLNVGDRAELVNAWRYEDVNMVLASIRPDTKDPSQKKVLTFDVSGSVIAGQTFNISVGQQSANFDYIVPNSAIREDSNGKFILIVESQPSPLGTRYKASRVDVEVIASDDTQSAVSSAMLSGYEFVITTSTQPVEAGQLVRLANN